MNPYLQNLNRIEFLLTFACTGRCKHCAEMADCNASPNNVRLRYSPPFTVVNALMQNRIPAFQFVSGPIFWASRRGLSTVILSFIL